MRVLLAAFGSRGDVQPMLALGMTLRDRGHAVKVCLPPDFAEWARQLGLDCRAMGGSMRELVERSAQGLRGVRYAMRELPRRFAEQYRELEPLARECDVMVGSTLTAAGAAFAERFGVRYHYAAFSPCIVPSGEYPSLFTASQTLPRWLNRLTWSVAGALNNLGLRGVVNAERRRLGLRPIRDVWAHLFDHRLLVGSDPALSGLPAEAPKDAAQTGSWFLPEREGLPDEVEEFLGAGPPPVFLGFGSMPDRAPARTTAWLLGAVRRAGVRALMSRGVAGLGAEELPPGVMTVGALPHGRLFPRCAAVVHHGGSGTVANAARSGVPQLVVPHMTDQFYWRARLLERGLMPAVAIRRAEEEGLAEALRRCVEEVALRERARAFAGAVRGDGVVRAAEIVEGAR